MNFNQADCYQKLYPPGTRILLLRMGDDPNPVEEDMRGTVDFVDDIGTVHCTFDNGRHLGLIPWEDAFRLLTQEELLEEEQEEQRDEEEEGLCLTM